MKQSFDMQTGSRATHYDRTDSRQLALFTEQQLNDLSEGTRD